MSTFVVDASVVVKWLVPEPGWEPARQLAVEGHRLVAPDLLGPEVANALWCKQRAGELSLDEARRAVTLSSRAPLHRVDSHALLIPTFDLAASLDRTIYDSLYLALALRERCQLLTADARFHHGVARALPGVTVLLGDR